MLTTAAAAAAPAAAPRRAPAVPLSCLESDFFAHNRLFLPAPLAITPTAVDGLPAAPASYSCAPLPSASALATTLRNDRLNLRIALTLTLTLRYPTLALTNPNPNPNPNDSDGCAAHGALGARLYPSGY